LKLLVLRTLGVLLLAVAGVFGIQAWRTWRYIRHTFASQAHPVAPLPGAVAVTTRTFKRASGEAVAGFWVPPKNGAAILLVHGTDADRTQLWPELQTLGAAGFGVLAIDWPGSGESEGLPTIGTPEREAFTAAVDLLAHEPDVKHVGVLGFSQGASIAVVFAADEPRVEALLAVGAWTDALEQTHYEFRHGGVLRQWPAYFISRHYIEGGNVRPFDVAPRLRGRPSLFVCGADDDTVPPAMADALANRAGGTLWRIEGSGHLDFRKVAGAEWPKRLLAFFAPLSTAR
jgi:pimeloyl-ACP methyl ester carboxylesterase